ncbi:response regulator [Leucobacter komagatae]|uniref:LuxR family transcriptional regulator n=1 Tax=Leucobacter komagatae TaxID=55969 RepID=A0A0D0H8R6_9MICO|nr:response regulator transcription factor [Leucobacter komagatae]KIP53565.1 LuxR family transcriptional regulator [Leucobacter komagatae]
MTRVVLVDDQALVREGIRGLLAVAGFDVVGEAEDGMGAVALIEDTRPDVALIDIRMPRFDGLWALRALKEGGSQVPVLVLTTFDDDEALVRAIQLGARGYLLKDITLAQLTHAVEVLAGGATLFSPAITERVLRAVRSGALLDEASATEPPALTSREREILGLVAQGYGNRRIAEALFLAEGTVKNHLSSTLAKLGARDRTSAVLLAIRAGILG